MLQYWLSNYSSLSLEVAGMHCMKRTVHLSGHVLKSVDSSRLNLWMTATSMQCPMVLFMKGVCTRLIRKQCIIHLLCCFSICLTNNCCRIIKRTYGLVVRLLQLLFFGKELTFVC